MQEPHATANRQVEPASLILPQTLLNRTLFAQQAFKSPEAGLGVVEKGLLILGEVYERRVPLRRQVRVPRMVETP